MGFFLLYVNSRTRKPKKTGLADLQRLRHTELYNVGISHKDLMGSRVRELSLRAGCLSTSFIHLRLGLYSVDLHNSSTSFRSLAETVDTSTPTVVDSSLVAS